MNSVLSVYDFIYFDILQEEKAILILIVIWIVQAGAHRIPEENVISPPFPKAGADPRKGSL